MVENSHAAHAARPAKCALQFDRMQLETAQKIRPAQTAAAGRKFSLNCNDLSGERLDAR